MELANSNYIIIKLHKYYYIEQHAFYSLKLLYKNMLCKNTQEKILNSLVEYLSVKDNVISLLILKYFHKYKYNFNKYNRNHIEMILQENPITLFSEILKINISCFVNGDEIDKICIEYF